ncbi:hypothetical protein GSU75_01828 [Pseudomonas savastanoi pv. phaseolicola]|nr:hypothetical protein [Pseudomonas savastanoi pv. phaseolicola]
MSKAGLTNIPTAEFIRSMREVATTLNKSSTSLLSAAVRLAETGQDSEAQLLIDLVKGLHSAEDAVRKHSKEAGVGRIMKLSEH